MSALHRINGDSVVLRAITHAPPPRSLSESREASAPPRCVYAEMMGLNTPHTGVVSHIASHEMSKVSLAFGATSTEKITEVI